MRRCGISCVQKLPQFIHKSFFAECVHIILRDLEEICIDWSFQLLSQFPDQVCPAGQSCPYGKAGAHENAAIILCKFLNEFLREILGHGRSVYYALSFHATQARWAS